MGGETRGGARPPESDEDLVEFLENAPVGICWVDSAGRLLWTNRTLLELLGSTAQDCLGHSIAGSFIEPGVAADMLQRLGRGETVSGREAAMRTSEGAVRRVLIGATGLLRDGRFVHSRWVIRDITTLLEREQAARHRALDAGRIKDDFLALLSHELRAPLGTILVWLGLLREGESDPTETAHALDIVERSARTLERIIEDLLHASRIAAGGLMLNPQLVDLRSVVQVALDGSAGDAMIKGLAIIPRLGEGPIWVTGDPGRLQQAVSNLLSNAIKFTPAGGRVEVLLDATDRQARLVVADSGEGMSPAFLPFAFERFRQQDSTTTRAHHGLGLGLYVVRHVIDHHGGVVSADSPGQGRGSTFTVQLPLAAAPREAAPPQISGQRREGEPRLRSNLTILLVDDEEDTRDALRLILQQNGMLVTTAAAAREAYDLIESLQPDILLSDIAMPGEDGLSFIRRVRMLPFDRGGQVPAIALSAYAGAEDRRKALLAGFQRHLSKPVDPAHLLATILTMVQNGGGRRAER